MSGTWWRGCPCRPGFEDLRSQENGVGGIRAFLEALDAQPVASVVPQPDVATGGRSDRGAGDSLWLNG